MAKVFIVRMAHKGSVKKPTVIQRLEMQRTAQMGIAMHICAVYHERMYGFNLVVNVISDGGCKR